MTARLLDRLVFTAALVVAMAATTAVLLAVLPVAGGHHPPGVRLVSCGPQAQHRPPQCVP